ncbi:MAG: HAD-IA family hydrolase, partial [Bacilli bacterium]
EIHKVKPNSDFYEHILSKHNINPNELLFLDDNLINIEGAIKLGINTIKVNKDTNLFEDICRWLEQNNS